MNPASPTYAILTLIITTALGTGCARNQVTDTRAPPISTQPATPAVQDKTTPPQTASDHYARGEAALIRGDRDSARLAFSMAAQSQSDVGKRAQSQLYRFDVIDHPEKYIAIDAARDARGYVMVNLQNRAAVKVRNIKVAVAWFDAMGNIIKQDSLTLADQLDPKESITEATRVGPLPSDEQLRLLRIKIFSMDVDE